MALTDQSFEIVVGALEGLGAPPKVTTGTRRSYSRSQFKRSARQRKHMLATMPMLIYKPCRPDTKGFVKFWSSQYNWIVEPAIYDDNIGLELTEGRIWNERMSFRLPSIRLRVSAPRAGRLKRSRLFNVDQGIEG
jgi:hypothetical protein